MAADTRPWPRSSSPTRGRTRAGRAGSEALRGRPFTVWRDDEIPADRAYAYVIRERLAAAKAVLVLWSAEAAKSEWMRSEAERARAERKLVRLRLGGAGLPMPFEQVQYADLSQWSGDPAAPGWSKVLASLADLTGAVAAPKAQGALDLIGPALDTGPGRMSAVAQTDIDLDCLRDDPRLRAMLAKAQERVTAEPARLDFAGASWP